MVQGLHYGKKNNLTIDALRMSSSLTSFRTFREHRERGGGNAQAGCPALLERGGQPQEVTVMFTVHQKFTVSRIMYKIVEFRPEQCVTQDSSRILPLNTGSGLDHAFPLVGICVNLLFKIYYLMGIKGLPPGFVPSLTIRVVTRNEDNTQELGDLPPLGRVGAQDTLVVLPPLFPLPSLYTGRKYRILLLAFVKHFPPPPPPHLTNPVGGTLLLLLLLNVVYILELQQLVFYNAQIVQIC